MNITNKLVPSRRFQEFKDAPAWERYKVEDFFPEIFSGNRLPKDALREGPIPYVIAQTHNNGIYMTIQQNTVDYHGNPMKLFQAPSLTFSIDNPDAIFIQEKPFFTSNIMRVLHKNGFRREYYTFFLESIKKLTTSYNWGLKFSGPVVMKSSINIPIDKSNRSINFVEMEKIGKYIQNLDKLIILRQHKLEKLKELKTSYLAEIFPVKGERKPKRRFLGFTEAWEQRELGEILDVNSGKDYKHLKSGPIPVYGTGGYMLSVNEALSYSEDAIGIGRKGTIDKPYLLRAPFWTVDTLFYAVPKKNYDLDFLHNLFRRIDWKSRDESTGVPSLSQTTINVIKVMVPGLKEQVSVGAFFSRLDSLITLHQRKLEKLQNIKKAYLYEMFPRMERE